MIDDSINHEYIIRYLRGNFHEPTPLLAEMREFAEYNDIPIAEPETAALIRFLCGIKSPRRILEIGTAIGYSSILMAESCNAEIVTLERNDEMYSLADKFIKRSGFEDRISIVFGDALETISSLTGEFDIVFIDASKGHYDDFLNSAKISRNGIFICDNVLYKGMTATDELLIKRKTTIVKRMRKFISSLCENKEFYTALLPIGDGVLLAYKNPKNQEIK